MVFCSFFSCFFSGIDFQVSLFDSQLFGLDVQFQLGFIVLKQFISNCYRTALLHENFTDDFIVGGIQLLYVIACDHAGGVALIPPIGGGNLVYRHYFVVLRSF